MAIKLEILTENKEALRGFNEIRDAVVKTSNLLEQIAKNMGKFGKAGINAAKETDRAFDQANQSVSKLSKEVDKSTASFDKLAKAAGAFFTLQAAQGFAQKIFEVRSEIESLQTSFRILVGDKDKADQLFQGIKEFATSTPMQMKDLASAAQTMLGFGLPLEQIMQNLKAIGDVSGGDAQRFQALALSFSQMSAAGKLMGQDLMQMINAGFNPLATISEKTGKSIGKLKDEMSAGAISADMVRQAFIDATSEGGKFYGMLEQQSKTLRGAYSNLQGAIDDMLNSIGEKTQGAFTVAIDMATTLAKNYETVGTVILGLIGTYGLYKAAVLAVVAAEKGWTIIEGVHYALLLAQEKAQKLLNATMLANPYVAVAAALGLVVTAIAALISRTSEADSETKKLNETFANTEAEIASEQKQIDTLFDKLGKAKQGTAEYKAVKDQILSQYGGYLSGLGAEISSLRDVAGAYRAVSRAAREAAMARGMEAAMKGAQESYTTSYSTNYDKIYNAIEKNYGADTANRLMKGLQKKLQRDGKLSADVIDKFGALKGVKAGWLVNMSVNEGIYQSQRERIEQKFRVEDTTTSDHKIAIRDKAAIEEEKKAAQAELDALSVKEAAGKKGAAIRKRIAGYEKELSAYDPKSDEKSAKAAASAAKKQEAAARAAAAAEKKEQAEEVRRQEALEKMAELKLKQKQEQAREERDLEFAIREATIKSMKEGTEKTIAQIELDYDKEIEAIRKGNEELLQKRIEAAKALWDADPSNKGKNFYASSDYAEASQPVFTLLQLDAMDAKQQAADAERNRRKKELADAEADKWREYEIQYGNYQQKRLAITEKYNKLIEESNSDAQKAVYSQQAEKELEELDDKIMESSGLWSGYFEKFESRSSSAIRGVMSDIQDLIYYMSGMEGAKIPDIFKENKETVDAINEAMEDPEARAKFIEGLRKQYKTFEKMVDANNPFKMISKGFKDGSNKDMADGFKQIADAMGQVQNVMSQIGVSADSTAGKITSTIGNTASLAAQGAQIGGVYGAAAGAALGIAQGLVGAFGADYSQYQKLVEEYTNLINVWDTLIEKKKEYISESYGVEAAKAGKEAESLVNKEVEAWRRLGRERLNAGASAGSHSIGVRIRQKMTAEDWRGVGYDLGGRLEGLFDLSAEQLERLMENAPGFWAKLDDDVRKYLENIIKGAETLEDIQEKTRNQLTSTSFDTVYDSFLSSLADMDKSAYDFSKDFEKYMFNAVLNAEVGAKFKERLKTWYANFAESTKGGLSDDELAMLKAEYDTIVREGVALRDELAKVTGYGSSGEGDSTFKSVSSFTQEQGDVLNGRLTAIQIAVQNGNLLRQQMVTTLGTMSSLVGGSSAAMDDMRDLMAVQNTHLEDIVTLNKKMLSDFGEKIERIAVNTQNL